MILEGARCADMEPGPWDVDASYADHRRALEVCAECPITAACLRVAEAGGYVGVWGGRVLGFAPPRRDPILEPVPSKVDWLPGHSQPCSPAGASWARRWGTPRCKGCQHADYLRARGRRSRQALGPQEIKHGTAVGYQQHRLRGEASCEECLEAARANWRRKHRLHRERMNKQRRLSREKDVSPA